MCQKCLAQTKIQITDALQAFRTDMGDAVPEELISMLEEILTGEGRNPENLQPVIAFGGASFEEVDAALHAIFLSPAALVLQNHLSTQAGVVLAHLCGCGCHVTQGKVSIEFSPEQLQTIRDDYSLHLASELRKNGVQLKLARAA